MRLLTGKRAGAPARSTKSRATVTIAARGAIAHIALPKPNCESLLTPVALIYKHFLGSRVCRCFEYRAMHRREQKDRCAAMRLERVHLCGASYRINHCEPPNVPTPFAPPRESGRKVQILAVKTPPTRVPGGALSRVIHHRSPPRARRRPLIKTNEQYRLGLRGAPDSAAAACSPSRYAPHSRVHTPNICLLTYLSFLATFTFLITQQKIEFKFISSLQLP